MEKFDQKKSGLKDKLGEAVEQVGNKVSDMGAEKLGKRIHDAGDKIETSHKNPAHPVEPQQSQKSPKADRDM